MTRDPRRATHNAESYSSTRDPRRVTRDSFVHLHVHSTYSKLEGVNTPRELCRAAKQMGFEYLALTDTNGIYGALFFVRAAREEGIKPILGSEIQCDTGRALLLVRNQLGYVNLCRLLSARHCDPNFELKDALTDLRQGLFVISDDFPLLSHLSRRRREGLFVELSPGCNVASALAFARQRKLPPLVTSRVRFIDAADYPLYRVLRAIDGSSKLSRLDQSSLCPAQSYLMRAAAIEDLFPHVPDAIVRTTEVAKACKSDWQWDQVIFPRFRQLNDEAAFSQLQQLTREGALWRYAGFSQAVVARIDFEMDIIRQKGYAHYFLVLDEISRQSSLTCGRGSAAASIVSFCLGITHVDPLKHNLFFERFLHPERRDPPDIDLDFAWDERDAVLDWVFARYGSLRAAMVANHNGFKWRGGIREVARVYGVAEDEISRMIGAFSRRGLKNAAAQAGVVGELPPPWGEIIQLAARLKNHLRCLSVHCGGVVIVPDDVRRYVPLETAAKGVPLIQWEKDQTEDAGLVKIDLLGNRSLAVIRDALAMIKKNYGCSIDYPSFNPLNDEKTCQLIRRGDTLGCFYVESPATRLLLKKMWGENSYPAYFERDVFEHLVMASSIIRPAANSFTRQFVARMHGAAYDPLHPLLKEVLDETYGVAIYQEQITRIAMQLAGFSAGEGDTLRKIISKKDRQKTLRDLCDKFFAGARRRGVAEQVSEAIWQQILSFAGYSFCKPHSASYALVSFKSAYLRAHFPAEFMAAVISNQGGFYTPFAYLNEARRMGLSVRLPSVNHSQIHYTAGQKWIRIGLMQIKGLSQGAQEALLKERDKYGTCSDFNDLMCRTRIDFNDLRLLVKAGACDELCGPGGRPAMLWALHVGKELQRNGPKEGELFAQVPVKLPAIGPYSTSTMISQEIETLGFLASRHPLSLYRRQLQALGPVKATDMANHLGRRVKMIGWFVTGKPTATKHGQEMEFVSFEDTSAIFETTLFPKVFCRYRHLLNFKRPYVLEGKVEEDFGAVTLNVERVSFLQQQETRHAFQPSSFSRI